MKSHVSVPISTVQFLELANFLQSNGDPRDPVDMIGDAIRYWLDNAGWKPELLKEASSDTRGYQWKNLFLPHGTQIRMQYRGRYSYAKIECDEIIYGGNSVSPGGMANTIAGTSRNAWRDLWIKRPGDKEWKLADECRHEIAKDLADILQEVDEYIKMPAERQQP